MFYLHPWEFLERKDLPKNKQLVDILLKRNAGIKAWKIFTEFIESKDCKWIGCGEWIEKNNHSMLSNP